MRAIHGMLLFTAFLVLGSPGVQAEEETGPSAPTPKKKVYYSWHTYQDLWGDPSNPPKPKRHRRARPERKKDKDSPAEAGETADLPRTGEPTASEPLAGTTQPQPESPPTVETEAPAQKPEAALQANLVRPPEAQGVEFPLEPMNRPLVLPRGLSEVRTAFRVEAPEDEQHGLGLRLEGRRGLTRGIDAGLSAPLMVQPDLQLGDLQLDGTFDVLTGSVTTRSMAVRMSLLVPVSSYTDWSFADFAFLTDLRYRQPLWANRLAFLSTTSVGGSLGERSYLLAFVELGFGLQLFRRVGVELTSGAHAFIDRERPVEIPLTGRATLAFTPMCDMIVTAGSRDLLHTQDVRIDAGVAFRL